MKTGIQGGTFDPIHFGHLCSAEDVSFKLKLDRVIFIPSGAPPHKSSPLMASASDRFKMVKVSIEDHPVFYADSIELDREGFSYTIDTLKELSETSCKGDQIFFIIGEDAFLNLHTWKEPLEILDKVNFAVTLRKGYSAREIVSEVKDSFNESKLKFEVDFLSENKCRVIQSKCFIEFVHIRNLDISSSNIRENIKNSRSIRYLLPRRVERFIIEKELYA
ncbi:MAG: nicotinate-nucleotide adenylyltransferase [Nitrospinota bacterium]|nr:nicotinate-nucleotide adenylyltransferase [Nitrospinota bacterium]